MIRKKYVNQERLMSCCNVDISESEQILFEGMVRWHRNLHLADSELQTLLKEVNKENMLDVEEHMSPLPQNLRTFLTKKLKDRSLKGQFSVNEILQNILPSIKDLYDEKLDERNNKEEEDDNFDNEMGAASAFAGINSHDLLFYRNTFMPAALYFIYRKVHKHSNYGKEERLMQEVFGIGTGSKTVNFTPEVVPFCDMCKSEISLGTLSQEQQHNLNIKVFKQQVCDNFIIEGFLYSCSDSFVFFTSKEEENASDDVSAFNPFSPKDEESIRERSPSHTNLNPVLRDEETKSYECPICSKRFSRVDFVEYHKKLFHKEESDPKTFLENNSELVLSNITRNAVIPQFVEDKDVDLMITFDKGEISPDDCDQIDTEESSSKKRKRGVRKVLKYPK